MHKYTHKQVAWGGKKPGHERPAGLETCRERKIERKRGSEKEEEKDDDMGEKRRGEEKEMVRRCKEREQGKKGGRGGR